LHSDSQPKGGIGVSNAPELTFLGDGPCIWGRKVLGFNSLVIGQIPFGDHRSSQANPCILISSIMYSKMGFTYLGWPSCQGGPFRHPDFHFVTSLRLWAPFSQKG